MLSVSTHKVQSRSAYFRQAASNQGKKCKLDHPFWAPSNTQLIMPFSCSNCPFIIFAKNAVGYRWYFRLFCRRKLLKVVEGGGNIRHQSKKRPICVSSREGTYYDQISKHFLGEKVMFNVASYYVFFPSEKLTFFVFNLKCQEKNVASILDQRSLLLCLP